VDGPPEALSNRQRRERARALTGPGALRVVLDLSYADAMTEGELRSLKTQVKQAYAENLRQLRPVQLTLTSVDGAVAAVLRDITGFPTEWAATVHAAHFAAVLPVAEVVILSPDASDVLDRLDPGTYYVIGGLVDRAGQPGVSLARARQLGVRAARLPLAEHVRIVRSNRLPINQVTSILAEVGATGDWAQALVRHIPKATRTVPP
jgi:tRNA (guanine9-N1)-methyltransferase